MSWKASAWAKATRGHKTPGQKLVLMILADYYQDEEGAAWPSQYRIADDCEMPERTVRSYLKSLENDGFITVIQKGNQYQQTRYSLNLAGAQVQAPAESGAPAESASPKSASAQSYAPAESSTGKIRQSKSAPAESSTVHRQPTATALFPALIGTRDTLIEPTLEPPDSKRGADKTVKPSGHVALTEDFIEKMIEKYQDKMNGRENVQAEIDNALNHVAYRKRPDKQKYLDGWLRRALEFKAEKGVGNAITRRNSTGNEASSDGGNGHALTGPALAAEEWRRAGLTPPANLRGL